MTKNTIPMLVNGQSSYLDLLILTNNWIFRTNILNISLDRNSPYIHDIVMGICSVSPTTLRSEAWGHAFSFKGYSVSKQITLFSSNGNCF